LKGEEHWIEEACERRRRNRVRKKSKEAHPR